MRKVASRIHSFVNEFERLERGIATPTTLIIPAWKWYKGLADWYRSTQLDDFTECPDPFVPLFDTELDKIQFGWNSLKLEDWQGLAQWLQSVGLVLVDMELLWRPTDRFGLQKKQGAGGPVRRWEWHHDIRVVSGTT